MGATSRFNYREDVVDLEAEETAVALAEEVTAVAAIAAEGMMMIVATAVEAADSEEAVVVVVVVAADLGGEMVGLAGKEVGVGSGIVKEESAVGAAEVPTPEEILIGLLAMVVVVWEDAAALTGSKAEVVAALLAVGAADSALGPDQRRDLGRDRGDTNVVVEDHSNKSSLKLAPSYTLG